MNFFIFACLTPPWPLFPSHHALKVVSEGGRSRALRRVTAVRLRITALRFKKKKTMHARNRGLEDYQD